MQFEILGAMALWAPGYVCSCDWCYKTSKPDASQNGKYVEYNTKIGEIWQQQRSDLVEQAISITVDVIASGVTERGQAAPLAS